MGKKNKPHFDESWVRAAEHAAGIAKAIAKAEKRRRKQLKKQKSWIPKDLTGSLEMGEVIARHLKAGGFCQYLDEHCKGTKGFSVQASNLVNDTFMVRLHKEES